jgi:hypothetical protein
LVSGDSEISKKVEEMAKKCWPKVRAYLVPGEPLYTSATRRVSQVVMLDRLGNHG